MMYERSFMPLVPSESCSIPQSLPFVTLPDENCSVRGECRQRKMSKSSQFMGEGEGTMPSTEIASALQFVTENARKTSPSGGKGL
jgi:predicted alternative tryptophan synthase beta-subunit